MPTTAHGLSDRELMRLPRDGRKYEWVDGGVKVSPAGARHGEVAVRLTAILFAFVDRKDAGTVFESSTGFRLSSGNVRSPDVSFVSRRRLPRGKSPEGFFEGPPDLAVEILSPEDRERDVLDKVGEYLTAGTRLVWVIDPGSRSAAVYRSLTDVRHLSAREYLDGEDTLPGLRCKLGRVFP
jgi:Uma2 family endonuclease